MTTLELQNTLIDKIHYIEDPEILNALNVLIDSSYARAVVYELFEEEESIAIHSKNCHLSNRQTR